MGTRATRNRGVDVEMTIIVEQIDKKQSMRDFMLVGIESSVASISLVKRFTIRPRGVESKKLMFALRTE